MFLPQLCVETLYNVLSLQKLREETLHLRAGFQELLNLNIGSSTSVEVDALHISFKHLTPTLRMVDTALLNKVDSLMMKCSM